MLICEYKADGYGYFREIPELTTEAKWDKLFSDIKYNPTYGRA